MEPLGEVDGEGGASAVAADAENVESGASDVECVDDGASSAEDDASRVVDLQLSSGDGDECDNDDANIDADEAAVEIEFAASSPLGEGDSK